MTRLLFLAALVPSLAAGQGDDPRPATPRPWWVNVGLGAASDDMLAGTIGLTVARSAHRVVTVRTLLAEESVWCIGGCAGPLDRNIEVGVLYGIAEQQRWYVMSLAAGLGVTSFRRTTYEPRARTTNEVMPGIPLEGQLFLRPFRNVGLGASVAADVNPRRSYTGLLVGLQLGRLSPPWGPR